MEDIPSQVKTRRQLQAEQTKDKLFEAAVSLLAEKDFEQITIRDIVAKAHVSIGTFYNYYSTKMDLNRRVCLPFALIWGPLAAVTARYIHPLLRPWLNAVPPWLTLAAWLLLTVDSFFTVRLLLQYHDIDLLSWKKLLRRRSAV